MTAPAIDTTPIAREPHGSAVTGIVLSDGNDHRAAVDSLRSVTTDIVVLERGKNHIGCGAVPIIGVDWHDDGQVVESLADRTGPLIVLDAAERLIAPHGIAASIEVGRVERGAAVLTPGGVEVRVVHADADQLAGIGSPGGSCLATLWIESGAGDRPDDTDPAVGNRFGDLRAMRLASIAARTALDLLVGTAWEHLDAGDRDRALAFALLAGRHAWHNHPGRLTCPRLDALLQALAGERPPPRIGPVTTVLHVLTMALPIGGHTRFLSRWIRADEGRTHRLAVIEQAQPLPAWLHQCVDGVLDVTGSGPWEQIERLRAAADRADLVVLHHHPHDIVPVIAVAGSTAPVVIEDHADGHFWTGASIVDLVAEGREQGCENARRRRGVGDDRIGWLPTPIEPYDIERQAARRQLGIDDDERVVLTVSSGYKYAPGGHMYLDVLAPVIEALPGTRAIVVGPAAHQPAEAGWVAGRQRLGERLAIVESVPDPAMLLAAADVYLDSMPVGSQTAALEAGRAGLPIVMFQPRDFPRTYMVQDEALDTFVTDTPHASRARLAGLLLDDDLRRRESAMVADAVERVHGPAAFRGNLERLYEAAIHSASARPHLALPIDDDDAHDAATLRMSVVRGATMTLDVLLARTT